MPMIRPPDVGLRPRRFRFLALRRAVGALLATTVIGLLTGVAMYVADAPARESEIRAACMRAYEYADLYEIHPCQ
jgi:hypothetical protein